MTPRESARLLAEKFIDYQPRTTAEVRRRLTGASFDDDVVESVLSDLLRAGLLNDAQFSQDWVESRSRRKGLGKVRLGAELRRKGISAEETTEALSQIDPEDEVETALALARKRIPAPDSFSPSAKRRLAAYLQRRGYNWETVQQVFERLFANNE